MVRRVDVTCGGRRGGNVTVWLGVMVTTDESFTLSLLNTEEQKSQNNLN